MNWIELFGIAASVIVAISLMMKSVKRLRIINALGAAAFCAYGVLIGSLPVAVLNGLIVVIDFYYLAKMRLTRDAFALLAVDPEDSEYFRQFIAFYRADIARFQPEFPFEEAPASPPPPGTAPRKAEFVLRDMVPVALIVYRRRPEGGIDIELDYAVPSHRDFKSAEFYFGKAAERIAGKGEVFFHARASVPTHARYLERLGFEALSAEPAASGSGAKPEAAGSPAPRLYRKLVRG